MPEFYQKQNSLEENRLPKKFELKTTGLVPDLSDVLPRELELEQERAREMSEFFLEIETDPDQNVEALVSASLYSLQQLRAFFEPLGLKLRGLESTELGKEYRALLQLWKAIPAWMDYLAQNIPINSRLANLDSDQFLSKDVSKKAFASGASIQLHTMWVTVSCCKQVLDWVRKIQDRFGLNFQNNLDNSFSLAKLGVIETQVNQLHHDLGTFFNDLQELANYNSLNLQYKDGYCEDLLRINRDAMYFSAKLGNGVILPSIFSLHKNREFLESDEQDSGNTRFLDRLRAQLREFNDTIIQADPKYALKQKESEKQTPQLNGNQQELIKIFSQKLSNLSFIVLEALLVDIQNYQSYYAAPQTETWDNLQERKSLFVPENLPLLYWLQDIIQAEMNLKMNEFEHNLADHNFVRSLSFSAQTLEDEYKKTNPARLAHFLGFKRMILSASSQNLQNLTPEQEFFVSEISQMWGIPLNHKDDQGNPLLIRYLSQVQKILDTKSLVAAEKRNTIINDLPKEYWDMPLEEFFKQTINGKKFLFNRNFIELGQVYDDQEPKLCIFQIKQLLYYLAVANSPKQVVTSLRMRESEFPRLVRYNLHHITFDNSWGSRGSQIAKIGNNGVRLIFQPELEYHGGVSCISIQALANMHKDSRFSKEYE